MDRWGGAGESYEVNDEAGNEEFVPITGVSEVEGEANRNTFSTNLT